jgi:hypothetical protein
MLLDSTTLNLAGPNNETHATHARSQKKNENKTLHLSVKVILYIHIRSVPEF